MAEQRRVRAAKAPAWIQVVPNISGFSPRLGDMVAGQPLTHNAEGKEFSQDELRELVKDGSEFLDVVELPGGDVGDRGDAGDMSGAEA